MFKIGDEVEINDCIEGINETKFLESIRGYKMKIIEKDDSNPTLTTYFLSDGKHKIMSPHFNTIQYPFPFVDADLQLVKK